MDSVDIVIPNYNYGRYLRQAVESIRSQDFLSVQVLIMDNASEDDSVEIANQLAREDGRIEVLARKKNVGLTASLNEANDWASSEYLICLSADDLLAPGALRRAVTVLEENQDVAAAFGRCHFFQNNDDVSIPTGVQKPHRWTIQPGHSFIKKAITSHMVTLSPMVRTSIQKKVGYYRQEAPSLDAEMWWRWACHGKIASTNAVHAIQRVHEENISNAFWKDPGYRFEKAVKTCSVFFEHEGGQLKNAKRLRRRGLSAVGKDAYWSAWSHLLRGEGATARKLFKLAFKLCPTATVLPPIDYLGKYQDLMPRLQKAVSSVLPIRGAVS